MDNPARKPLTTRSALLLLIGAFAAFIIGALTYISTKDLVTALLAALPAGAATLAGADHLIGADV